MNKVSENRVQCMQTLKAMEVNENEMSSLIHLE